MSDKCVKSIDLIDIERNSYLFSNYTAYLWFIFMLVIVYYISALIESLDMLDKLTKSHSNLNARVTPKSAKTGSII